MNFAPTILTEIFESEDDKADVREMILQSAVMNEDGRLIPHTILMPHEDYPDNDVMVDVEGRRWVTLARFSSLEESEADKFQRLAKSSWEFEKKSAEKQAELEKEIAQLQRAFRDTFSTLAFGMPSKEEFNAWYDRNVAVMDGVIAAKRRAA